MGATATSTPAPSVDGISGDPRTYDRTVVVDRITNHAVDAPDPRDISWLVLDANRDMQSQQLIYKALFKRPIGKRPIIALKALLMLFSVLQEGPPEFALLTVSNDKFLEWAQNEWSIENVRGKHARREYAACFSDGSIAAFTRIIRRKAAFHRDYAQAFMPDWRPVTSSIDRALALRHAVAVTAILHIFNGAAALFRAFSSASDTAAPIKGACATRLAAELSATFQAARLVYDRMDNELDRIDTKEDIDNALVTLQSTLGAVTASSDISSLSNFAAVKKARADYSEKKAAKINKPKGVEKNEGHSKGCKTAKIVASGVAADSAVPESSSDTPTRSSERVDTEKVRRLTDAGDKNRDDDVESIPVLASFENLSDNGEDVRTFNASKKRVKVRRSKSKPPADAGSESDDEAADVDGQGNVVNGSSRATDARRNRDIKSNSARIRSRKSDCADPRHARNDDECRTGVGHDNISDDEIEKNHVSSNANDNDRGGKSRDVRSRASRIRKQTRTAKGVGAVPRDSDVRRPVATRRRTYDGYDSSGSCHSSQGSGSGDSAGGYASADAADAGSDDGYVPRSSTRKSKSRPDASARPSNAFQNPVRNKQSDTLGKIKHRRSEQRPAAPPVSRPSAPSPRPNVSPSAVTVVRGSPAALAAAAHGFKTPRMDPRYEIEPHEVRFGNQIGSGGFGVVFKGKFRGETVAIKKIHAHALNNRGSIDEFRAEVSVLCTLRHPNILSFLGACVKAPNLMIVTEFMARGTLFDILHQSQMSVTWAMRRKMALDTCRGMRYLHESKLLHRDLKSSNLMLDNDFNCKVGDFGLTRISKGAVAAQMTGQCGTFQYMAVEVLASKPYSEKADVFSFGILLWELVARKLPYFGMQPMQVGLAVVQRGLRPTIPPTCPAPLAKLMQACWDNSPNRRPSFEQIERSLTAMPEAASVPTAPA
jgi:Protein tyrosine and serine/threonine kinase